MNAPIKTSFLQHVNPWTNQIYREVPRPQITPKRLGKTKYDEIFDKLMKMESAIEIDHEMFAALRRAFERYCKARDIKDISFRKKSERTGITIWLDRKIIRKK